jgi:tetratricopeptide (TPR) repeat protein
VWRLFLCLECPAGVPFWFFVQEKPFPVALQYYDQVLKIDPDDYHSVNNIGATFLEQGNYEEAKQYFLKSLDINDKYANAHYGIGNIYQKENDIYASFESTIKAIRYNPNYDRLMKESLSRVFCG